MKQNISSNKALVSRENFAFHSHARKLSGQPGTFLMYSFLLHFRIFKYPINANDNSERGRDPLKSESRLVAEGTNSERRVRWNRKLLLESTILDTIHERERERLVSPPRLEIERFSILQGIVHELAPRRVQQSERQKSRAERSGK